MSAAILAADFFEREQEFMKSNNGIFRARMAGAIVATLFTAAATMADETVDTKLPPDVLAAQGGVQVTMQDIDAFAQKIPEKDRAGFFDSPKRLENILNNMLLRKQLAAQARKQNLDKDPIVGRQLEQAADEVLSSAAIENYRASIKLPDFEGLAQEYYLVHKEEFAVPGAFEVKHVLVSNKQRSDEEAKARIAEVEAAARAHPDQFDALVEKYSDDPSKAENHGLIADSGGKTSRAFSDAAKALKNPGDISRVVKTSFGYHVLQLVSHQPDTQKSFADVRPEIVKKLRDSYISKQMDQYTGEIRGRKIDANPDLVATLRTRYLTPGMKSPSDAMREDSAKQRTDEQADGKP